MQKIILVGTPITGLRLVKSMTPKKGGFKVFSFDMRESGSPSPPRYLPKAGEHKFTVYINEKQLKSVGLDNSNIKKNRIFIQGEITLSVPKSECYGDMGVICFNIKLLEQKEKLAEESKENYSLPVHVQVHVQEHIQVPVQEQVQPLG